MEKSETFINGHHFTTFTHASEYTIVIDANTMEPSPDESEVPEVPDADNTPDKPEAPDTGDYTGEAWIKWWIVLLGSVIMIIGFGVFCVVKKKEEYK